MKCGAGKVVLFATPGSAPQRVLRGGVGSVNRRRPLKPPLGRAVKNLIARLLFSAHISGSFIKKNFCYTVDFILKYF